MDTAAPKGCAGVKHGEPNGIRQHEEKEVWQEVLTKKPGVLIDSRRLPRDEWVIETMKNNKRRC